MLITGAFLDSLKTFSKSEDSSAFLTVLTAFFCMLARYTGTEDIVIGSEVAERTDPAMANVVGPLSNQAGLASWLLARRQLPRDAEAHFRRVD